MFVYMHIFRLGLKLESLRGNYWNILMFMRNFQI